VHFTRFVAIDWSGAVGARQRGIAIAACARGSDAPALVRPGHIWSREEVADWVMETTADADTLIGFDLSPAFPFVDCGAYFPGWRHSPADAGALWALVEAISSDDPHLSASSFVDHPDASRHFRRHGGRQGDFFTPGAGRMRAVEILSRDRKVANPYSCFNLVGAAQVGKSSLTGMRVFHRLSGRIPIWPFDPLPASGSVVVEIYTSIAAVAAGLPRGRAKIRDSATLDRALARLDSRPHVPLARYDDHSTDAILSAAWLRRIAGDRASWSPPDLTPHIARTEGWTFGIV
jgi:hypothetical protein